VIENVLESLGMVHSMSIPGIYLPNCKEKVLLPTVECMWSTV